MAESEGHTSLVEVTAILDPSSVSERRRQVVLVAFEGILLLDLVGPAEVLDAATRLLGDDGGYQLAVASPGGRGVRAVSGLRLSADLPLTQARATGLDTLIVPGGLNLEPALGDSQFIPQIRRLAAGARRTCSICTGAFLLAASGLLDGRRATTHWAVSGELQRRYPAVRLEPDRIFVRDGNVMTSAGVTAGIDLALALVEEDHGPKLARTVARWIVVFLQRPGGQAQFSERLALPADIGSPLRAAVDRVVADPAGDHREAQLAHHASVSQRHLRRLFAQQAQTTPARFVERVRVEAARNLLETTTAPTEEIAARSGFGASETMRRAFHRTLGITPSEYRNRFQSTIPVELAA
jgi:transcriptional regulator GlxA family with amidase domain